jgi:hypothetical protein
MEFAFIIIGGILIISGAKGTTNQLTTLVKGDLQGKDGYLYWIVAILVIGSLGYISQLRTFSHWFLALVLVVLVLKTGSTSNPGGGFFQQFTSALSSISNPSNNPSSTSTLTTTSLPSISSLPSLTNLPAINF